METGVLAEELTCSVCLGLFQDPVVLPCQHSFCTKCISDAWDHSGTLHEVNCPQCRKTFNPRPSLVKSHTLQNIVEKYIQSQAATAAVTATDAQSATVMCEYCIDTPTPAVKTCLKCETSFCSLHLQPHLTKQIYKEHSLIEPIADLTRRQCPSHKKVLEFYCEQDEECVCISCTVIGSHKSHNLLSLEEAQDKLKEKLKNKVENIHMIQKDWSSEHQDLEQAEIEVKRRSKELKEKLSTVFSKWRKQLEEDEKSALKLIDEEEHRAVSEIKSCSDSLIKKMEEIELIDKEAQDQEQKDPLSFLQDVKQLLSRYSQLQLSQATIKKQEINTVPAVNSSGLLFNFAGNLEQNTHRKTLSSMLMQSNRGSLFQSSQAITEKQSGNPFEVVSNPVSFFGGNLGQNAPGQHMQPNRMISLNKLTTD
ncbi:E3 ubiquitin/ISG15 ligase TRIM25-like isoform X2 [Pristis pectinata]|uniref:E3 ubiquitin/ISG15 ligase TRIM25-like isoform X2 n=1 Tax=Pristis pectinata TaxID=685728 RepID=UPI00223CD6BE|nr:E3 ubiquitin/ISG15 ligase TRIM25-like isoform X2 [Pristis pectinata]